MIFIVGLILNIYKDYDVKFITVNGKTVSTKVICRK